MNGPAQIALAQWGGQGEARLISHRENAVYEVRLADGQRAALRLHRPGYNSRAEIESELWWTATLADRAFPVPRPIAAQDGRLLVPLNDNLLATMLDWAEGAPIGAADEAFAADAPAMVAIYRALGKLLARLHNESDALHLSPAFQRRCWDGAGLLGDAPLWGRFWDNPALDQAERRLILDARDKARRALESYRAQGGDFGLIHADALRENVFSGPEGLILIDFDDSGYGYRMYDLAVAISQNFGLPDYPALRAALLGGYGETRQLRPQDIDIFPLFAMLRCFASLGWAITRVAPESAAMAGYVARALTAARHYIG